MSQGWPIIMLSFTTRHELHLYSTVTGEEKELSYFIGTILLFIVLH